MLSFHRDPSPLTNVRGTSIGYAVGLPAHGRPEPIQRGETCAKAHTRSSVVDRVCACNVTRDYGAGVSVGVADSVGSAVAESVGAGVAVPFLPQPWIGVGT